MSKFWDKTKQFMGFVEEEEIAYPQRAVTKKPLVNFSTGNKTASTEIRVFEPRDPDQSLEVSNALRGGIPVIINLKYLEADESKRLFDFVCGTAYAIDGHFRKLGDNILLFTPGNINICESDAERGFEELEMEQMRHSTARVKEY
ncbi:MAG: cell division protein SepF [Candidatus Margulisiibacteriota bacterium]